MTLINSILEWLAPIAGVSFAVLAIGALLTWSWGRPIERLRSIQATVVALVAACLLQQFHVLPQVSLGWLSSSRSDAAVSVATESTSATFADQAVAAMQPRELPHVQRNVQNTPGQLAFHAQILPPASETVAATAPANQNKSFASRQSVSIFDTIRFAVVVAFFGGAAWSVFVIAASVASLRKLRRDCEPACVDVSKILERLGASTSRVSVLVSPTIEVPVTYGIRTPVVILPRRMAEAVDKSALRDCLAHEWSHICRRDIAMWWTVQALQPLLWFQPAYWLLRRELRLCQDQVADHFAAGHSSDALSYAELLVNLAKTRHRCQSSLVLTMNDGRSNLARRIQLLVSGNLHLAAACRTWTVVVAATVLIVVSGVLGTINLGRAETPSAPQAKEIVPTEMKAGASSMPADAAPKAMSDNSAQKAVPQSEDKSNGGATAAPAAAGQAVSQVAAAVKSVIPDSATMGEELPDGSLRYAGVVANKTTMLPIKGAVVTVRRRISSSYENRTLEETKHTTDDAGKYSFVIPPAQLAERFLYIELDVEHPDFAKRAGFGYALSMIRKNAKLGDPPFYARVEMEPVEPITGRLVGPDGKALTEVAIQAFSMGNSPNFESASWFNTKSDAEGKFRLSLTKDGQSVFWIVPDRLAPKQVVSGAKRGDWGDVQLEGGVAVKGQVLDATGKPLAGVFVNVMDRKSQAEIQFGVASHLSRAGQSDAEGRFEIGPMKPGTYELDVGMFPRDIRLRSGPRNAEEIPAVFPRRTITINPGEAQPLLVRAVPHVKFEAQYFDSKGKKQPGWGQRVFGKLDGDFFFGKLDGNAEGTIHGLLPLGLEDAQIELTSNEHGALRVRLGKDKPLTRGRRIQLGTIDGDITDVEIIKYTAPIVQIKVVDEEGQQVANAKLAAIYDGDDKDKLVYPVGGMPTSIFFENQPGGIRRTSQLLPDEKTKFVASAEGYDDAQETLTLPEGETRELTLVLKKSTGAVEIKPAAAEKMDKPEK